MAPPGRPVPRGDVGPLTLSSCRWPWRTIASWLPGTGTRSTPVVSVSKWAVVARGAVSVEPQADAKNTSRPAAAARRCRRWRVLGVEGREGDQGVGDRVAGQHPHRGPETSATLGEPPGDPRDARRQGTVGEPGRVAASTPQRRAPGPASPRAPSASTPWTGRRLSGRVSPRQPSHPYAPWTSSSPGAAPSAPNTTCRVATLSMKNRSWLTTTTAPGKWASARSIT